MAGVPSLEHGQGFAAADFADDDAVRPHRSRALDGEIPMRHGGSNRDLFTPAFCLLRLSLPMPRLLPCSGTPE